MKKTWIITALLTLVIGAPCAFAKKPKGEKTADAFSRYDKNGNGSIDGDEIAAVKAALATDADLKKFDTDSDGKLSDNEIAAMKPAEKKKKKKNK